MSMNMDNVVYWHKDQVIIRLKSQPISSLSKVPVDPIEVFNKALIKNLHLQLRRIDTLEVQNPHQPGSKDLVLFNQIEPIMQADMESMQGNAGTASMSTEDQTLTVIKHLNSIKTTLATEAPPDYDVLPHWLWSGTDDIIHGCPVSPPIPVEEPGASGRCKISLRHLPDSLQDATGDSVTVFILDTLPPPDKIENAANNANSNMLLQGMTTGMTKAQPFNAAPPAINLNYSFNVNVPDPAQSATTGKDIYGRLVGFPMPDHGLAIAGIVRDLAPDANIECIRVLNDYGVGDINSLGNALNSIYNRMSQVNPDTGQQGDLYQKPVVINLSLVVLPPENDVRVTSDILQSTRDLLYSHMQNLADLGAVFVASAGNDTDPRDPKMNPTEMRFGSRYPAAFADDDIYTLTSMIPVGAVNRQGKAASYSNYPGLHGIGTYGGELPKPEPWLPSAMSHINAHVHTTNIDALCGVYTNSAYPALSGNDHYPPLSPEVVPQGTTYPHYMPSNSSTWAYWSGTSFATPIISALAARILQGKQPKDVDVRQAIIDAAKEETKWTGTEKGDVSGPMIMASQTWNDGTSNTPA